MMTYQQGLDIPAPPPPTLSLRPYQEDALDAIAAAPARGISRPLVALPTGAGKTVVFAHLAARRGGRTLVLAHRDELIRQAADKLRQVNPLAGIGIVQAESNQHSTPVVVASIQTLARQQRLARMPRDWTTIIVDEAHHATADSYVRTLEWCGSFDDDGPLTLGVTATPERSDSQRLSTVFQEIVYQRTILDMILEGYLVDLRAVQVQLAADFSQLHIRAGDFVPDEVEQTLLAADAPEHVVAAYQQHAAGRKALLFTPTVKVAHLMSQAFAAAGIRAAAIDGETPSEIRREILARFKRGEIQVLANCAVLTEGYDEPSVDCIIIARPTKSRPLFVQMLGRGTRLHPGKDDCMVLDLVGASTQHDIVTVASLFDLPKQALEGESVSQAVEKQRAQQQQDDDARRDGRLVGREVDLFRRSALHWISLGESEHLLSLGDDTLWLEGRADGWEVVRTIGKTRQAVTIAAKLSLEYAQGVAEDIVRREGATTFTDPDARWRRAPASEKQIAFLLKWGVPFEPGISKGDASDLMTRTMAGWNRRRRR